jgi:4-hydroxy-tetrahydrodipicolinate synthase
MGCDGLNILGTTGEANSLGLAERMQIMTAAARAFDPTCLMVGTGTADAASTIELTRHAAALGYGAALVLPPFYYKPVSDAGLFQYFSNLCAATSRAPVALFLYNFPALTGVPFSAELVARLARELNGRVCGIKDSSGDIAYCRQLVRALPDFRVFPSSETCLVTATEDGFAGCISATVNITAGLAARVWRRTAADGAGQQLAALRQAIAAQPLIPAVKYLISERLADASWERLLPPLMALGDAEKKQLQAVLPQLDSSLLKRENDD